MRKILFFLLTVACCNTNTVLSLGLRMLTQDTTTCPMLPSKVAIGSNFSRHDSVKIDQLKAGLQLYFKDSSYRVAAFTLSFIDKKDTYHTVRVFGPIFDRTKWPTIENIIEQAGTIFIDDIRVERLGQCFVANPRILKVVW
ncbi:MAG: hypothetical protein MUF62_12485 [Chitinophagaceae bacterium]|jgi:hypothetical protein|nr:hypothetical protein [Chitinophagaceae bacterium]